MPTSDAENKPWARDAIVRLAPRVVVDLGAGDGTYARLARAQTPDAHWIAVEAWGPYVTDYGLTGLYDQVVVGDVRYLDLTRLHPAPDLVIAGDMLEHLDADQVEPLVRRLQAWTPRLLVSIPVLHLEQGAVGGNEFECHRSEWTYEAMLGALGPGVTESVRGDVLAYYLWERG
jgi:hypothetical protein